MKKFLAVIALSAIAAFGADASGKFSGSFVVTRDGDTQDEMIILNLKQSGSEITGTAGPNAEKQFPIKAGKIEGSKIQLTVDAGEVMVILDLALDGDHLTGNAKAQTTERQMTAKIDAKRES